MENNLKNNCCESEKINRSELKNLPITLVQFLKWSGIAMTGGEAKELISEGLIYVNQEVCFINGKQLKNGDLVRVENTAEGAEALIFEIAEVQ